MNMTLRVDVNPNLLNWAIERSGGDLFALSKRFPKLNEWLVNDSSPTLKQLEAFSKATQTPVGYFFLKEPPKEEVPIPDYRTMGNARLLRPSANLLDTIYICQQRQEWYKAYARTAAIGKLPFVGSKTLKDSIANVAKEVREFLNFDIEARAKMPRWENALNSFVATTEAAGVLVMKSGIVGNNTRRKLDPQEFRGFALVDATAPLIFINGADTKSAQMFTLAHELAHLWLGESALSSAQLAGGEDQEIERWCNAVAAELLVPMDYLKEHLTHQYTATLVRELAKRFKVSTLVIIRRMFDAGYISKDEYIQKYRDELEKLLELDLSSAPGGDFYRAQPYKLSSRFARAVVVSTLEGQTLYRDALRLLGVKKVETFNELGRHLGVVF